MQKRKKKKQIREVSWKREGPRSRSLRHFLALRPSSGGSFQTWHKRRECFLSGRSRERRRRAGFRERFHRESILFCPPEGLLSVGSFGPGSVLSCSSVLLVFSPFSDEVRVLEGVVVGRPVGEAGEGSGRLPHAAGDVQRVGAERGRHGQVGELRVEVPQVCGARH